MDPAAVVRFFGANGDKKLSKDECPEPAERVRAASNRKRRDPPAPAEFYLACDYAGRAWPGCPTTGGAAGLF
jgi:hypothetical protein